MVVLTHIVIVSTVVVPVCLYTRHNHYDAKCVGSTQ